MARALLPHQQKIFDYIKAHPENNRWGLFLDMGLGKTFLACAIAAHNKIKFDHIYIFCPASLKTSWVQEIIKDNLLLENEYTIFPYSLVSLKKAKDLPITDNSLLILDESHFIKNPKSKRTRFYLQLLKKTNPSILSLTGTPDPRNILDLWIQCHILKAWTGGLELNYWLFQQTYAIFKQFPTFRKMIGEKERDLLLKGFVGKAFFIKKEDVLNLPEKLYEIKYYELTREQKKYLKELKEDAMTQVELTSDYILRSMHNFLAVCSGFVTAKFDEEGKQYVEKPIIELLKNPKLDLFEDIALSIDKQFIVFCVYHKEIEIIQRCLKKNNISFSCRHGRQSAEENNMALQKFVDGKNQVLIATVQSTSVGLTMVNCDTIIYFNNTYDLMHRVQSEDRIHRIGQDKKCVYIDIVSPSGPDYVLLQNLKGKKVNMDETFKLFLKQVDDR